MLKSNYYDNYWKGIDLTRIRQVRTWKINVIKNFMMDCASVLDVGCGDGYVSKEFLKDKKIIGVDISLNALRQEKDKVIQAIQVDLNKGVPFKDNTFDLILILDVLEHVFNPVILLEECLYKLKDNGLLIISVPNMSNIINRLFFLGGEFKDFTDNAHVNRDIFSEHIHFFSIKIMDKLLNKLGLRRVYVEHFFPKDPTEKFAKRLKFINGVIFSLRLYKLFPSLFALAHIFVCTRNYIR